MISHLTSAVISLQQMAGTVSKKLKFLEKHFRHSHADLMAANANSVSHVQILLPNEMKDDNFSMGSDKKRNSLTKGDVLQLKSNMINQSKEVKAQPSN